MKNEKKRQGKVDLCTNKELLRNKLINRQLEKNISVAKTLKNVLSKII